MLSETIGYEKAHWLVFSVCKPQAKHYLQVTEIAIKCPDVTTKPSNYILPVRELTSLCPQLTVSDILWFINRIITTTVGGEGKYQQKKTSFISLLLSQKKLTIYNDLSAFQSKNWMYKHVYRLSGRPKFESLSTESVSVGLPTRNQENVIFYHNWPPTLQSPSDMQLFDPFFTYLWFQNLALSYNISIMTSNKYLSLILHW